MANHEIAETAKEIAAEKKIPLLIDSRFNLKTFPGATTATPNQDEVEQILGEDFTDNQTASNFANNLGYESLLITRGNKGMLLIEPDKSPVHLEPSARQSRLT